MKSFGEYILENMGDDLSSDTRTDLDTTDPSEESVIDACRAAIEVSKPELLQFLRDLANKFPEVKDALAGTKTASQPDDVVPPAPDTAGAPSEF